jgi:hypothetical protein
VLTCRETVKVALNGSSEATTLVGFPRES